MPAAYIKILKIKQHNIHVPELTHSTPNLCNDGLPNKLKSDSITD